MARGHDHKGRGEYDKAVDEYSTAYGLSGGSEECRANLETLLSVLGEFFEPGGDPGPGSQKEGSSSPEMIKEMAARTNIPPGYLVTTANRVMASFPLTPEGREAAIEHADRLASGIISAPDDEEGSPAGIFLMGSVVYEHDTRPREIYAVNPKVSPTPGAAVQGSSQWIPLALGSLLGRRPTISEPVAVQPVLFLAEDHRGGNISLILNPIATERFHTPLPDRPEVLGFKADPVGMTVAAVVADLDPHHPQILVETSAGVTLSFGFGSDFAEAFWPGGFAAWGRGRNSRADVQRMEAGKAKPFEILGAVVQAVETPDTNYTLFFTDECRDRWHAWYEPGEVKVTPRFDIQTSMVRFSNPPMTFNIRLAVKKESSGEVRYLRSSTQFPVEYA